MFPIFFTLFLCGCQCFAESAQDFDSDGKAAAAAQDFDSEGQDYDGESVLLHPERATDEKFNFFHSKTKNICRAEDDLLESYATIMEHIFKYQKEQMVLADLESTLINFHAWATDQNTGLPDTIIPITYWQYDIWSFEKLLVFVPCSILKGVCLSLDNNHQVWQVIFQQAATIPAKVYLQMFGIWKDVETGIISVEPSSGVIPGSADEFFLELLLQVSVLNNAKEWNRIGGVPPQIVQWIYQDNVPMPKDNDGFHALGAPNNDLYKCVRISMVWYIVISIASTGLVVGGFCWCYGTKINHRVLVEMFDRRYNRVDEQQDVLPINAARVYDFDDSSINP